MRVTEVRLKLAEHDPFNDRLLAYCTIVIENQFAITDMKLLQGDRGYFVGMPARKISDRCDNCNRRNHLRAAYCNNCGDELDPDRVDENGVFFQDSCFPITREFRAVLEEAVILEYNRVINQGVENICCRSGGQI